MMSSLPIFAGQGIPSINAPRTRQRALLDAASPSGSVFLTACHHAFHSELSSLPIHDQSHVQLDLTHFPTPEALIEPSDERYAHHPVLSNVSLFLIQALRYLTFVQSIPVPGTSSRNPFELVLERNHLGIIGFSSGILPACVVATSLSLHTYVSTAVETFRLSLWIGIRSQLYRRTVLAAASLLHHPPLPWSLVFVGITKEDVENAVLSFNEVQDGTSIYVTAIIDPTCFTVSGRPDLLADFAASFRVHHNSDPVVVHQTTVDALYHSPTHDVDDGVRNHVLADVAARQIPFPGFSDLKVPLWSTYDGKAITDSSNGPPASLLEAVLDMILTQPVDWQRLVENLSSCFRDRDIDSRFRIINIGPGTSLVKTIERSFSTVSVDILDLNIHNQSASLPPTAKQEPIAVVGMAVNMPGAPHVETLWNVLKQGISTLSQIPEDRFKVSGYGEDENGKRFGMKVNTGNFISGVDEFDHKFFGVSPREARSMDPQQRILLHTVYEALEDAGYVPNSTPTFRQEAFGCFIGAATHDYAENLRDDLDVYYSTGTLKAFLSGRISYAMGWSGPSVVVDTACSSSTVAVYQAARALMNRDCDAALAGGVNVISSPQMFLGLDRGHFLSQTGGCKSFDASADGYSRAEGCGAFVLKRLSDAVAEKDRILGVIRAIEVNQSGTVHSITHPHTPTQEVLFRRLLAGAGMDPERVSVVEAHGTGTRAGDPAEVEAIRNVFCAGGGGKRRGALYVTSVKANVGHLEAASGAAGLAKLLLMLRYGRIPRQISLERLNPKIAPLEDDGDGLVIPTVEVEWRRGGRGEVGRVAVLNNFGAAGSNSSLLLEEYIGEDDQMPVFDTKSGTGGMSFVFGMSAKDKVALEALRQSYLEFLRDSPRNVGLADIAYTSTARRQLYDHRLAVSAENIDELVEKLSRACPTVVPARSRKRERFFFVFSGQGVQYLGMGRTLYRTSAVFRRHVDRCHDLLVDAGFPGVLSIINAETSQSGSGLSVHEEFEAFQAAILALEYSLAKLWMSWGVIPAAVVGHSLGEYAALVIAGVMSIDHALLIVAKRVRLMVERCSVKTTGMIAVNLGPRAVEDLLQEGSRRFAGLSISCYNSPIDCVVSGPLSKLQEFKAYLDTEVRCKVMLLSVPFGYHSEAMRPVVEELDSFASLFPPLQAPRIPVVSTVFGKLVAAGVTGSFDHRYFSRHCVGAVFFERGIQGLLDNASLRPVDAWIELGPHVTTLPMLKTNEDVSNGEGMLLGSLRKKQDPWTTLTASLVQLYEFGVEVDWRSVFAHVDYPRCVKLPSYPFLKTKFWVPYKESGYVTPSSPPRTQAMARRPPRKFDFATGWRQFPSVGNAFTAIYETPISQLARYILGHRVAGIPLCPGSVYIEMVFAGIALACDHLGKNFYDAHVALRAIEFTNPLVYDEDVERWVTLTVNVEDRSGMFTINSRIVGTLTSSEDTVHCHGEYYFKSIVQLESKFARVLPLVSREISITASSHGTTDDRGPETFSTRTAYDIIFPRLVDYAKGYHTMRSITVDTAGMRGYAAVRLPTDHERGDFFVHPVFIDTLLHVAGFVANLQGGSDDAYICSAIHSLKVASHLVDPGASYTVFTRFSWMLEKDCILSDAYALLSAEPGRVVAFVKGMEFRRVPLGRLKKGLVYAVGKTTLLPPFQMKPTKQANSKTSHTRIRNSDLVGTPVSEILLDIIASSCDVPFRTLRMTTDLDTIGMDSLLLVEILARIRHCFPDTNLHSHLLSCCRTVGDVVREVAVKVDDCSKDSSRSESSSESSPRTPFSHDSSLFEPTLQRRSKEFDVKHVLANVLEIGIEDIDEDSDLESMGLDSLSSIEALHVLKQDLGLELPSNLFNVYQTPRTVQSYVTSHLQTSRSTTTDYAALSFSQSVCKALATPFLLQDVQSPQTPLFLVHDGSGLINYYTRLSPLGRPVWGIHNPRFSTSESWNSIDSMAKAYVNSIISVANGPVILGGWSFGGALAYEIALLLRTRGVTVIGIILIDSPSPLDCAGLSDSLIETVLDMDLLSRRSSPNMRRRLKAQFSMSSRMLREHVPKVITEKRDPSQQLSAVLLRSTDGFNPPNLPSVPLWIRDRSDPKQVTKNWEMLVGSAIKVIDIPGNHFDPFHPSNIDEVSLKMMDGCAYLENLAR